MRLYLIIPMIEFALVFCLALALLLTVVLWRPNVSFKFNAEVLHPRDGYIWIELINVLSAKPNTARVLKSTKQFKLCSECSHQLLDYLPEEFSAHQVVPFKKIEPGHIVEISGHFKRDPDFLQTRILWNQPIINQVRIIGIES